MTTNTLKKFLAASAVAATVLLPIAASAHGLGDNLKLGGVLNFIAGGDKGKTQVEGNGNVNLNTGAKVGDRDNDGDKDDNNGVKATVNASTTAAVITKKSNRLQDIADFAASFGTTLESKIAALGTTSPAVATATVDYKTQLSGAKTQAQAAIATAATLNTANSTTTNAAIKVEAQAQLKAARDFLAAARADLVVMLKFLWH